MDTSGQRAAYERHSHVFLVCDGLPRPGRGFLVARRTGRRQPGGALLAAAGAWCARDWHRASGPAAAAALSAPYVAAMGRSHPLAKPIGAWPSVAVVTAVTVAAAELVTRTAAR